MAVRTSKTLLFHKSNENTDKNSQNQLFQNSGNYWRLGKSGKFLLKKTRWISVRTARFVALNFYKFHHSFPSCAVILKANHLTTTIALYCSLERFGGPLKPHARELSPFDLTQSLVCVNSPTLQADGNCLHHGCLRSCYMVELTRGWPKYFKEKKLGDEMSTRSFVKVLHISG